MTKRRRKKHKPEEIVAKLRVTSAVLSENSDDWETEHAYLNMEAR